MPGTETIILITKSRYAAHDALRELKRLHREGWIDLTCYTLVDADERSGPRIRETSDRAETISSVEAIHVGLQPGDSALLVTVEQRYAERVAEEFETRGQTLRRQMQGGQSEVALRASIEGIKSKVAWLEELLDLESDKAGWVYGEERERLEAGIRAARTELNAERERLRAQLLALRNQLEAHLLENSGRALAESAGAEEIERDIADTNEDLALCLLDHLDEIAIHASELSERVARASAEEARAVAIELSEIEVLVRKYRGELTATLASTAVLVRRCLERVRGDMPRPHIRKLEQRHALLKADIQRLEKGDARTRDELAPGFRQGWRNVRVWFDEAKGGYG
jgi:hypothetical protein